MRNVKIVLKASYFVSDQSNPNYNIIAEFRADEMCVEDAEFLTRKFMNEAASPESFKNNTKGPFRLLRLDKGKS